MKMNVFKWVSVVTVVLWFSSCSMEKRLYSSGFHIQWNTKESGSTKNDWVKVHKQPSLKVATIETVAVSPTAVTADMNCGDTLIGSYLESPSTIYNSGFHQIENKQSVAIRKYGVQKSADSKLGESANVPKPRAGESTVQLVNRKARKAKIYGFIALLTIILVYPAIVFGIIHGVLKRQARMLDSNNEIVTESELRPGETVEDLAKRKANRSLLFGLISIPTGVFIAGIAFGVSAISNGREAKSLSPGNVKVRKRANAGTAWAIMGFVVSLLIIIWLSIAFSGDFFI